MVRENWNTLPWLDNAWQNAMHCVAREESSSPAIFSYFWSKTILKKTKRRDMLSLSYIGDDRGGKVGGALRLPQVLV